MIFVQTLDEINAAASNVLSKAAADAVIWFAYPKGTSRRYHCEFNRDTGWAAVGTAGFEPVRAVAIDEDWSALRFRRTEHIKTMRRDPARRISLAGKSRARAGAPRIVQVPDDLRISLESAALAETFSKLSYTHRKEFADGIVAAKKPETRVRRITKLLETLAAKQNPTGERLRL